ncbi:hypothetical protein V7x_54680 [Crateriforma conspicua]|uniref:DUF3127 domain-containing protein n=1 Tax=Crateriforma conspicua TaxID=2527996 RepID=A0A5C6FJ33_9PLAN|nr:DUF3127 domain-containing protein [Crateriforma conspicua]TWU59694.1 hypothetical protein V7x_54680 [Crateriforma conspicua]
MSDSTVRGVVHVIEETKTYGQKGFRKRLVVLEQEKGGFTNYIPVEFIKDGCDTVDEMNLGDDVEVSYRLSGRKWQRDSNSDVKYFLSLEAMSYIVLSGYGGVTGDAVEDANSAFSEAADDEDAPF